MYDFATGVAETTNLPSTSTLVLWISEVELNQIHNFRKLPIIVHVPRPPTVPVAVAGLSYTALLCEQTFRWLCTHLADQLVRTMILPA